MSYKNNGERAFKQFIKWLQIRMRKWSLKREENLEPQYIIKSFNTKSRIKLAFLGGLILVLFGMLVLRIMWINKNDGERYKKRVYSQQDYKSSALPFKRGDIVDRKGSKLAYSEKVYNLIIDSKEMQKNDGEYFEATIAALGKYFPNLSVNEIRRFAEENPLSQYKIFAKKLSADEIAGYQEYEKQAKSDENITDLSGVWFEPDYKRKYPYGSLACDVLGFTFGNTNGFFGLEEYYNDTLNGINGRRYGYLTEDSIVEQTIKPAVDGCTLVTTIDTNIQSIVEKHIEKFNEAHKNEIREGNGAKNIGCIIMNPNSGEILAMASFPTFDLNDPMDLTPFYNAEEIASMDEKEKTAALNQIWRNFCISDTYEPGSTAKPFTVAAAMECGAITGEESYTCGGALDVGGHTIHCHNRLGDGTLTVTQGIQKSCNVLLMDVAFAMGKEKWLKYNRMMNFGLKTNVDLAGEVNASSLVFNESMGQTDLAVGSFGQGFNVTMIQIASAYCSLINGGYYYQPHLVSKIQNAEGATVEDIEPRVLKQTISTVTSDKIRQMLRAVVMEGTEGTGWTAKPAGYTMGGKTGTAEKIPRDKRNYLVSFCGFVPVEDPQVLCYVVVDQPNTAPQDNARYATVLTKDIMTEVLPYMNIFMTEELTEDEKAELDEMQLDFSQNVDTLIEQEAAAEAEAEDGAEGDAADQEVGAESQSEEKTGAEGAEEAENAEGSETNEQMHNEIQYDAETGYPIDPNTGEVLDPDTLLPISGGASFMD